VSGAVAPAGGGLRARKRAQTEQRLADAALRLFAELGYDNTTIEAIADAAEVSPRTFFRYFESKEALLFALPNQDRPLYFISNERFRAALVRIHAQDERIADIDALGVALGTLASDIEPFREQISLLQRACAGSAVLRGRRADASTVLEHWMADMLHQRSGEPLAVCRTRAAVAMTLYAKAVERWVDGPDGHSLASCLADVFAEAGLDHRRHPLQVATGRQGARLAR
jgi:AcrR family transcriptional regulator